MSYWNRVPLAGKARRLTLRERISNWWRRRRAQNHPVGGYHWGCWSRGWHNAIYPDGWKGGKVQ